jgi:hypothetical protein
MYLLAKKIVLVRNNTTFSVHPFSIVRIWHPNPITAFVFIIRFPIALHQVYMDPGNSSSNLVAPQMPSNKILSKININSYSSQGIFE